MDLASDVKSELKKIVGAGNVRDEDHILTAYATDISEHPPSKADLIVLPTSKEEVSAVLKLANENKIPVTPRASNTLGFGVGLADGGILMDLAKLNKLVNFDEERLTVTVQAGFGANALIQTCRKRGFDVPVQPWFGSGPSMGSWISATGTGARVFRYGHCQEWIVALEVVLATGEIIRTGANTWEKHNNCVHRGGSGNLMNLFQMTFGTMGIITEVTCGLIPRPPATISVVYGFDDMPSFINAAYEVGSANAATDIEHEDGDIYNNFLERPVPHSFILVITNEGHQKEAEGRNEVAIHILEKNGGKRLSDDLAELTWDNAASFDYRTAHFGRYTLAAASCSYATYEKAYRIIKDTFKKYNIMSSWSGWSCWPAWVEGWAVASYDPATQVEDMLQAKFEINRQLAELQDYFFNSVTEPYENLLVAIKKTLDPNNILNPTAWDFVTGTQFRALRNIPFEKE